ISTARALQGHSRCFLLIRESLCGFLLSCFVLILPSLQFLPGEALHYPGPKVANHYLVIQCIECLDGRRVTKASESHIRRQDTWINATSRIHDHQKGFY